MVTIQYMLVANGHAYHAYPTRLLAVLTAMKFHLTSYDVVEVLVADLTGGF